MCSPWMMALLSDSLWRYYWLTEDIYTAELIRAFGDFFVKYGFYETQRKNVSLKVPWYLTAFEQNPFSEQNVWTDPQHNCSISTMLGKSLWLDRAKNFTIDDKLDVFTYFANQCKKSLQYSFKRSESQGYAVLKPPRRFGWMYSSTSELPWLMNQLIK